MDYKGKKAKIQSKSQEVKEMIRGYVDKVYMETLEVLKTLLEKDDACAKKYAVVKNGKIVHFKGPPGIGVRFNNCVKYFRDCKGYSEKRAKTICGIIAVKKRAKRRRS